MITDYKIVEAYNAEVLQNKVQHMIEEQWQPYGDLIVTTVYNNTTVYSQAMVKFKS